MDKNKEAPNKIKKLIRDLRSSNNFESQLKKCTGYFSLPEDTPYEELKAIIIRATEKTYSNSYKADVVLMALGLLKGFNNRPEGCAEYDGRDLVTKRRKAFFKKSLYLQEKYNGTYKDLIEDKLLNKEGSILTLDGALSTLSTSDGRWIDAVSNEIYINGKDILTYVREHRKDYFNEVKLSDNKTEFKAKLPSLKYIKQNKADFEKITENISEEPSHPDQPKCNMQLGTFEGLLIFIPICTLCICILLLICANIQNSNRKKLAFADSISEENGRPEIKSIEFKYKDFLLHPGQSIELEVEINPPSISAKKLDYTSSNPSVAKADKNIITANSVWVEEACHETVITAQGGGIAQGKAHITVKKREDTDGMTGRGINDAISDGDRTDFQLGE